MRDRVKELRRVRAGDLAPHPRNWRTHPPHQWRAMRGVLAELGYADALVARELPDGGLQLVDGHLRAETTPESLVPVLVVELDDAEAEKLLLTHDPLSALAGADAERLSELVAGVQVEQEAVQQMLGRLMEKEVGLDLKALVGLGEVEVPESYQVVVECRDATQQERVYEQMKKEGYRCRVLTL